MEHNAPGPGRVIVPVVVDRTGQPWAGPPCRVLPGAPEGDLLESADLTPAVREAVVAAAMIASQRGPGAHGITVVIPAGAAPTEAAEQPEPDTRRIVMPLR